MQNTPQDSYYDWYQKWQDQADFNGSHVPDEQARIKSIIALWSEKVPDGWRREDLPEGDIYRRGDRESPNTGKHQIEYDIISNPITVFSDKYRFRPIINAFPCATDPNGGRAGNVEIDLLGILTIGEANHPLICEIKTGKKGSKNPWYAAVENLRQLRLFIDNKENLAYIKERCLNANMNFAAPVGIVIGKPGYYTAKGQKFNSMEPTQRLLNELKARHNDARIILAKWCKNCKRIDRINGWELETAFGP
jgi:hypothetical protein